MPSSTDSPTTAPTNTPTSAPSTSTDSPTNSPTSMPTVEPTDSPTDRPTSSPTEPTEVFVPEINLEVCDFTVELYGRSTGFLADDVKVGFSSPGLEDSYVTGHLNVTLDRYRFEFLEPCSTDVVSVIIENAGNVEVEIQNMKVSRNGTVLFNNGCFDLGIEDSCASFEFTLGEQCGESLDSFGGIKLDACQVLVSNLTENTKTCQYTLDCTPFIGVIEEGKPLTYENNLPSVYYEGFLDCAERGYDFGYQMENCVPGNAIPFDNLFRTPFHAGVDRGTCQITNLGDFNLVCSDRDMEDGGLPRTATVTTSVDAVVMIQGENGGTLYTDLQAGDTYILGVGDNDAISDIEFCFRCPSVSVTAEDTSTYAPTTSPTFTPTIAITGSPTASGTEAETNVATQVATEATSTAAPTEGQTSSPTESPTSAPTDKPGPPGERYSGTLDCADRGEFDFGFQLEYCVPGKELKIDALDQTPFKKDVDQATCLVSNLGNFDLQCSDRDMNNGGLPRKATFTPHVDTAVLVQGNSGGTIYRDLKSGQTYDLEVGTGEPITTIELCLKCGNTKTTDRSASSFGDPHIKTWGGGHFDFHGGCDLVLLDSPAFANGLGLSVHIRTRIRTWWSYIDSVVLKIGSDRLEVQGGRDNSVRYWTNGKLGPDLKPDGQFLNFTMSGHKIWYHSVSTKTKQFRLTWDAFNSFSLETFGDFVRFNVNAKRPDDFRGARGLMGSYPSGAHMGKEYLEDCIFDVLATNDKGMAASY
ncbi:expressed unknown protein [Seminavis robusta]|uniref:VWFD domain-containing protein n=1 Tax=Seminavis robusta TaxID=568900 RepID=A0A9N8E5R8_9STRA|nr:expressed unknown protein [Seminavis robusta]|eukprot:Sro691_g187860.1 n/a (754) ;mRNA; r:25088-27721